MSVLDRSALEASPLADLHAIASELSIDGYRRLRRAELIDAILDKQEGAERPAPSDDELLAEEEEEDRATETPSDRATDEDRAASSAPARPARRPGTLERPRPGG